MFSFNLYDARMVERHLLDNMTEEESVFLQGSAVLLLALVKKSLNGKRERTHRF